MSADVETLRLRIAPSRSRARELLGRVLASTDVRWIVGLAFAAAVLRFASIAAQSYWFDEAVTADLVKLSFGGMLSHLGDTELSPPLYYVVAWPWVRVFGDAEAGLRSLSAVFGVALVPIAYAIGRELATRRVAIAITAIVVFNPLLLWYSQEARPYSMFALLSGLSLLATLRARHEQGVTWLAAWAVISALAVLTHYFAAFLFIPEALLLLAVRPRRRPVLAATGAVSVVGVALIPLAAYESSRIGTAYITSSPLARRTLQMPQDLVIGPVYHTTPVKLLGALAVVLALPALVLAVTRTDSRERRAALLMAAFGIVTVAIPVVLSLAGHDFLSTRNVLAAWLPLMLVLAIGYGARHTSARVAIGGVAALCVLGVASMVVVARDPMIQRPDWRSAAQALPPPTGARIVAAAADEGTTSLGFHLHGAHRLRAGSPRVAEVDAVNVRYVYLPGFTRAAPVAPAKRVGKFTLVESRASGTYLLVRYRASRPTPVSRPELAQIARSVTSDPHYLLQRPGGSRFNPLRDD